MIALVDCNSFYCSCEQLFRPDLKNKPVVVLSNNDGCAVSVNSIAKKLGIKVGMPHFEFKDLCFIHKINIFSANFSLYNNISERVMKILSSVAPEFEIYSIDEAFLNLQFIPNGQLINFSEQLKDRITRETGIPVSIGLGSTKVLAKMANYLCKKNPQFNGVKMLREDDNLKHIEARDIWGIGTQSAKKLKILGIHSAQDLKSFSNAGLLRKTLSINAINIQQELRGIQSLEFEELESAKTITCSRTFAKETSAISELQKAMATYVSIAGKKLRFQKSKCSHLSLYLRTKDGIYQQNDFCFNSPTNDERDLIKAGNQILKSLFDEKYQYKKCGICLSNISPDNVSQLSFFEPLNEQSNSLMKAMDSINDRFGKMSIYNGACQQKVLDLYHQDHRSPNYTLDLNQLPVAL